MFKGLAIAVVFLVPLGLGAQGDVYGPALRADDLANTPIGQAGTQVSYRFRADPGGVFQGARPFIIWSFKRKGYHAGTGGTLRAELREDDGSPAHCPSGKVLATNVQRLALVAASDRFYPQLFFDRAPRLKPGGLYHLVFSNTDPDPEGNFVSVNALFLKSCEPPLQPGRADADWAMLVRDLLRPAWTLRRTPGSREGFTPILEIDYAGGRSQGVGYIESWRGAPRTACTPSGALGGCAWVGLTFAGPQTLAPGQTYHLLLSAPASASYEVYPMRKGTDKGFSDATLFPDGHAEYRDGGAWAGWDQWGHVRLTNADLQFYFRLRP